MKYLKTLNQLKASNLRLDLNTMTGWSYDWYEIVKKIKRTVYLNTFPYSHSTAKHVSKLRDELSARGIKYLEVECPYGLQALAHGFEHHIRKLAQAKVRLKYARIKKPNWNERNLDKHTKAWARIGFHLDNRQLVVAYNIAHAEREERLERARMNKRVRLTNDDMRDNAANTAHSQEVV